MTCPGAGGTAAPRLAQGGGLPSPPPLPRGCGCCGPWGLPVYTPVPRLVYRRSLPPPGSGLRPHSPPRCRLAVPFPGAAACQAGQGPPALAGTGATSDRAVLWGWGLCCPLPCQGPREGAGSPGWGFPAGLSGAVFSPLPLPQRRWGPSCERGTGREGRGVVGAACATGAAPARQGRPGSPRSSLCLGHVPAGPTSPSRCPCAAQPFVHFSTPLAPTQHNLPGACARLKGSLYLRLPNHCEWGAALCRAEF